jgi:hypothetical protein
LSNSNSVPVPGSQSVSLISSLQTIAWIAGLRDAIAWRGSIPVVKFSTWSTRKIVAAIVTLSHHRMIGLKAGGMPTNSARTPNCVLPPRNTRVSEAPTITIRRLGASRL